MFVWCRHTCQGVLKGPPRLALLPFKPCYPDTRVLIFLPSRIPRTCVGFRHPCRIPSVIYRVPKNSNESDTRTRVGHRHPHPCPCNTGFTTFRNRRSREASILKTIENGAQTLFEVVSKTYSDVDRKLWIPASFNVRLHVDHLNSQHKLPKVRVRNSVSFFFF